jgi:hypothetical protein
MGWQSRKKVRRIDFFCTLTTLLLDEYENIVTLSFSLGKNNIYFIINAMIWGKPS